MQILFIYPQQREIYHFNRNNNKMDQLKFIYQRLSILVRETLSFRSSRIHIRKFCVLQNDEDIIVNICMTQIPVDEVKEYVTLFNYMLLNSVFNGDNFKYFRSLISINKTGEAIGMRGP